MAEFQQIAAGAGLVIVAAVGFVARTLRRDRRRNTILAEAFDRRWRSADHEAAPERPALAAGSEARARVVAVRDLPARGSLTAMLPAVAAPKDAVRSARTPTPTPTPTPTTRSGRPGLDRLGLDRPGVGDRVRAGGRFGTVTAVERAPGATRLLVRLDDGVVGHVDVPDGERLVPRALPRSARPTEAPRSVRALPSGTAAAMAPAAPSAPSASAPASSVVLTVRLGGFTSPVGAGSRS